MKELTRHEVFELFCKNCKKPEGMFCSGAGNRGYCDKNPNTVPEGCFVEAPGINWSTRVFGSLEDAEEFERTVGHRHDAVNIDSASLGGLQVFGYCVHYHMYD